MPGPPRRVTDTTQVLAGECTTTFEGSRDRTQRGHVVVVVKPDKTVLVHDADGYQPVAWLTRPEALTVETTPAGFGVTARTGDQTLRVVSHAMTGRAHYPVSPAGVPVGTCPDCDGALVRRAGEVSCLGCEAAYGLPAGAAVLEDRCGDCGLPRMRVERGAAFELCVDRDCDPLDDAVRERFDRAWACPDCGSDLRVLRRGGLLAGCDAYPDCDAAFSIPAGVVVDDCGCGFPVFETASGRRCLDATCDRHDGVGDRVATD